MCCEKSKIKSMLRHESLVTVVTSTFFELLVAVADYTALAAGTDCRSSKMTSRFPWGWLVVVYSAFKYLYMHFTYFPSPYTNRRSFSTNFFQKVTRWLWYLEVKTESSISSEEERLIIIGCQNIVFDKQISIYFGISWRNFMK